jgi:hypothetical protein
MIQGEISHEAGNVDLALLEDLVLGAGHVSPIVFRAPDGAAELLNLPNGNPAYRCQACSYVLIITDPDYTDTECLVCKTAMPAGMSSCPKCGWTYKDD